jgi:hypothetical protein
MSKTQDEQGGREMVKAKFNSANNLGEDSEGVSQYPNNSSYSVATTHRDKLDQIRSNKENREIIIKQRRATSRGLVSLTNPSQDRLSKSKVLVTSKDDSSDT